MSNKISLDEVKKIAKLSRLKINDSEIAEFTKQLDDILDYASKINELDTENILPTSHSISMKNVWREDETCQIIDREELLKNLPDRENNCAKVPKIIE